MNSLMTFLKIKKILIIVILIININVKAEGLKKVELVKCIDGDTAILLINNKRKKVRFLAIDAPENSLDKKEYLGQEASDFTCKLLTDNEITIEYDEKSRLKDKYGRDLVWVFVNNRLLQNILVKEGYAKIKYVKSDYKYLETLKQSEGEAKKLNKGIWQKGIKKEVKNIRYIEKIKNIIKKIGQIFKKVINTVNLF